MPLRGAVIGCGAIAQEHLEFLEQSPGIELVGVCDSSAATVGYFAERHHTMAFTDAAEMLESARPDVVHILTPPSSHRALTLASLAAGAHVICEKPLAATGAELEELLAAAEAADRLLIESQNYRFNDEIIQAVATATSGGLGEVTRIDVDISLPITGAGSRFADPNLPSPVGSLPGGAVHDFLPHMIYLGLMPIGFPARPDEVWSRWRNRSGNDKVVFDDLISVISYGDTTLTLRFAAHDKPDRLELGIRGTEGSLDVELFNPQLSLHQSRIGGPLDAIVDSMIDGAKTFGSGPRNLVNKVLQKGPLHGFPPMLQSFYDAVGAHGSGAVAPPVTAEELRACMTLVDAVVAGAANEGKVA